ncbi:phosphoenolpyruvate--protein phosphotransferase [Sporohalobacter salinus]|uniref:phosphoenolpyruvate--protein phosphotransferase n=1 Tax=Sporohalobacter salinus TaxID=1494606 RepID=UPI00195FC8D0|nr:phosphoenolpyruvate--protein phosphotransferase [Sporohalobacter salinus]MBM7624173.1 phosphotransferase system enzyme I (PtsI) [Sporohalobacter salinus]
MNKKFNGVAASPGIVTGKVLVLTEDDLTYETKKVEDLEGEKERLQEAIQTSKEDLNSLKEKVKVEMGEDKAEIFQAHLMLVEDPELISTIQDKIETKKINVEAAVDEAVKEFATMFENMDDEYMQGRASDIRDVGNRILKNLLGIDTTSLLGIEDEVILVARDLIPSDTAQIDKDKVLAFATEQGSRTSHTAIMARSLEIPAVTGVNDLLADVESETEIIVDGLEGEVILNPTKEKLMEYEEKAKEYQNRREELIQLKEVAAETKDGHAVELAANIGTPKDLTGVLKQGAEGIGLYRTEFLYMDRDSLPSEEEQFEAYKEVAEKVDGPVIIRTLDIGGDKELSYLDLPEEMNPFLGYRAIRISLDRPDVFKEQLRAILRASVYGEVKIMYPMISSLEELRAANNILEEVKEELRQENKEFDEDLEVGMMIEVPATAMIADALAQETDFFSIGTNDLIQYTTATDRMNNNISHLYQPFHPAILKFIKRVVDAGHAAGNWVGMCGEVAGDKRLTPFLLGIGLDEFSMSSILILEVKERIRNMTLTEAENIAQKVLQMSTAKEIKDYLE